MYKLILRSNKPITRKKKKPVAEYRTSLELIPPWKNSSHENDSKTRSTRICWQAKTLPLTIQTPRHDERRRKLSSRLRGYENPCKPFHVSPSPYLASSKRNLNPTELAKIFAKRRKWRCPLAFSLASRMVDDACL